MEFLASLFVWTVLVVFAISFYLRTRRWAKAFDTRWRRRLALVFFFAPLIAWLASLLLPAFLAWPFAILGKIGEALDALVVWLTGRTEEGIGWWWSFCLRPVFAGAVYATAGFLVGWPLDRRAMARVQRETPAVEEVTERPQSG